MFWNHLRKTLSLLYVGVKIIIWNWTQINAVWYKTEQVWANTRKDLIWESNDVKLLGINTDRDIKFDKYVLKLCRKANRSLSALSRMAKLLSFNKRKIPFSGVSIYLFSYCVDVS